VSRRWINTLVLYDAQGRVVKREGYWYDGPLALAGAMAAFDQDSYAFYEDDAGEATSTIIGSVNNQQTLDTDTTYQCRLLIQETNGSSGTVKNEDWEYNHAGGGWTMVETTSSVIIAVDGQLTQGNDTTQRIGSGTYDTTNSGQSTDGSADTNILDANNEYEPVLNFQIVNADVSDGDEILLRISGMDTYTRNADIDVNKAAVTRRVFVIS